MCAIDTLNNLRLEVRCLVVWLGGWGAFLGSIIIWLLFLKQKMSGDIFFGLVGGAAAPLRLPHPEHPHVGAARRWDLCLAISWMSARFKQGRRVGCLFGCGVSTVGHLANDGC